MIILRKKGLKNINMWGDSARTFAANIDTT